MPGPLHVVVLLGTGFPRLEAHGTRWRALLTRWARTPRVERLTAVDFPALSLRHVPTSAGELVSHEPSWLPGCTLLRARIGLPRRTTPVDRLAWRRTGVALDRALEQALPPGGRRLLIAATPLWVPVLTHVGADRRGLDAVDDWRALPAVASLRARVEAGYRGARRLDAVTAVSAGLASTLQRDFGLSVTCVSNGVDLAAYENPPPFAASLPTEPFAVYVGVVQERVDLELLDAVADAGVPVVVAGPASGAAGARLSRSGVQHLGPVPVELVPSLLARAAVGLVPHRVDDLTRSMNPMKVLEYLAAGLPVVSTPVPGSGEVSPRVRTAAGPEAFAAAVRAALREPRGASPDPAVLDRDWDAVADRLLDVHGGGL